MPSSSNQWSADVTNHSDALDLAEGVFTWNNPQKIATSLRDSAESSSRRKSSPYQSAMSMLNFYINRGGSNISDQQKKILREAKHELKKLYA